MKERMNQFFVGLFLGGVVIYFLPYLFDSVYVKDFTVAILVAFVLSLLNTFVKPVLSFFAFPLTFMTLGLFQLVINGFILKLCTLFLAPDFTISSFFMTIIVSIVISFFYGILGIKND